MGQNEQKALLVVFIALGFATLALASAPRWAACISSGIAVLSLVPLCFSRRELRLPQPLLLLLGIALGATALQLLPIPTSVLGFLSPGRLALAEANARAYGTEVPSFLSVSQDWPATLVELCKFAGYFVFAYVCTRLSKSLRAREWLLWAVAIVGVIVALCALGHRLMGADTLLGLYKPYVSQREAMSPFLNPNHLAGYLAFVTPVALGIAVHRRSWLFAGIATVCTLTSLQANSRAGLVALCVGLAVMGIGIVSSRQHGRHTTRLRRWVALVVVAAAVAATITWTSAGSELLNFDLQQERDSGKFVAWAAAPALLAASPWVGIGRGAFENSFPEVQPPISITFSHIENEYIQAVVDWGLIASLLMAIALFLFIRAVLGRRPFDSLSAGALGATAAILVQSVADFGLQFPGMALPGIAVAATLLPGKLVVIKAPKRSFIRGCRIAFACLGVSVCALGASSVGRNATEDIAVSRALAANFPGTASDLLAEGAQLSRRHPSSYLIGAKVAKRLWDRRDPLAFQPLARSLELNPNHYGVHYLAAEMLAGSQRPQQALAEYRLALEQPGVSGQKILESLLHRFSSIEEILRAVPESAKAENQLGHAFLRMKRGDVAEALARRSLFREQAFDIYELAVLAGIANDNPAWAVTIATKADRAYKTNESLLLQVKALRAAKLPILAIQAIEARPIAKNDKHLQVLAVLSALLVEIKNYDVARVVLENILNDPLATADYQSSAHSRLATIEDHAGNQHQAQWHRQRAADLREH